MITDNDLRLCGARTAQALAFSTGAPTAVTVGQDIKAASGVSTNTIDLSVVREIGAGNPLYVLITVTGAATRAAGTIGTTFSLLVDNDAALGSPTTIAVSPTLAKASLALGAKVAIPIPAIALSSALQYFGLGWTNADAADSFNVCADVVAAVPTEATFYPTTVTVL